MISELTHRFNSTFKVKPTALKRTQLRAKLNRARFNRIGRRTKDWRKVWRFLKPELEKRGRTSCEFRFIPHECRGPLDPAHSKKRNKLRGNDIYAVAIACRRVHEILDYQMSHEDMEQAVMKAINNGGGLILPEGKQ